MNAHEQPNFLYALRKRGGIALFCLLAALITSLCATGWADSLFTVEADGAAIILNPEREISFPDLSSKILYTSNGSRGYDITLREGAAVVIRRKSSVLNVRSCGETVSALLSRLSIEPAAQEMIGVKLTEEGAELNISSSLTYYNYVTENVPFSTQRIANPNLTEGEERIIQQGSDGLRSAVYEVVWSHGAERCRRFVEELDTTAVEHIIEYGTAKPAPKPAPPASSGVSSAFGETGGGIASVSENADGSGTLYLKDGTALNYSAARSMTATAYTTGYDGVGTITASGTAVHVGSVAVDKRVIPLGTRLYITASGGSIVYGPAVAEDTGVKGSTVDLYYSTYDECIQFGRRPCTVYILE